MVFRLGVNNWGLIMQISRIFDAETTILGTFQIFF